MTDYVTQLGVGGIFAVLVLRETFGFLHRRRNGSAPPIWYTQRGLETTLQRISEHITSQTEMLRALTEEMREMRREVREAKL